MMTGNNRARGDDDWILDREPEETDAEYLERAAMFRNEFARRLPDGRTISEALADGHGVLVTRNDPESPDDK